MKRCLSYSKTPLGPSRRPWRVKDMREFFRLNFAKASSMLVLMRCFCVCMLDGGGQPSLAATSQLWPEPGTRDPASRVYTSSIRRTEYKMILGYENLCEHWYDDFKNVCTRWHTFVQVLEILCIPFAPCFWSLQKSYVFETFAPIAMHTCTCVHKATR